MPRCYYYAIRLEDGTAQILTSTAADPTHLGLSNTKLLPEKRTIMDTGQAHLEWICSTGDVSQAAIALLAHATTGEQITRRYARRFQAEVLSTLPPNGWTLRADQLRHWVATQRRHDRATQAHTLLEPMRMSS
jgi:hypothetical protein